MSPLHPAGRRGGLPAWLTALSLILAACATPTTTHVTSQWKDTRYHEKIHKVLVISLAEEPAIRQSFEKTMVEKLHGQGVEAVASSDIIPADAKIDRKTVRAAMAGKGFDTVLVSRLIGIDTSTAYIPPAPSTESFDVYYSHAYATVFTPGYLARRTVVSIEIKLYDTGRGHLIWSLTSQTFNHSNVMDVIHSLSGTIIHNLRQQGLI